MYPCHAFSNKKDCLTPIYRHENDDFYKHYMLRTPRKFLRMNIFNELVLLYLKENKFICQNTTDTININYNQLLIIPFNFMDLRQTTRVKL